VSLRVYIGWDQRDALAYEVCRASLKRHASAPLEIIPLKDWELRAKGIYWRGYHVDPKGQMWDSRDDKPFSTNFSYTRFCVPILEDFGDVPVVFCDADMLWRADVVQLVAQLGAGAVACVKHDHRARETVKMTGNIQRRYACKNWSSLMVLRPSRCQALTPYAVNNQSRDWLHGFCWIEDEKIVALPEAWNWLDGWSDPRIDPKVVHFTRGTPDMVGYEDTAYANDWKTELLHLGLNAQGIAAR
jgi:hypothetical protein